MSMSGLLCAVFFFLLPPALRLKREEPTTTGPASSTSSGVVALFGRARDSSAKNERALAPARFGRPCGEEGRGEACSNWLGRRIEATRGGADDRFLDGASERTARVNLNTQQHHVLMRDRELARF